MSEFDIKNYIDLFNNLKDVTSYIKDYFPYILNQPEHVRDIIEYSLKQTSEYLNKKLLDPNESIRGDWYSEDSITDNGSFRILELTIKDIINSNDKAKSIYTAYFWANVNRTCNADIDIQTAYKYFNVIESISYRKLCIIKLSFEYKIGNGYWDYDEINTENFNKLGLQDQTPFYSISQDIDDLYDLDILTGASISTLNERKFVPRIPLATPFGKRLYELMNLNEILDRDITSTFSLWNVRPKT